MKWGEKKIGFTQLIFTFFGESVEMQGSLEESNLEIFVVVQRPSELIVLLEAHQGERRKRNFF